MQRRKQEGVIEKNELDAALEKHGRAALVVLHEPFETWNIGLSMRLLAMMAREIAATNIKARHPADQG